MLLEIIFRKAPKPPIVPEEPLVLEFVSVSAGKTFYVAMAFNIRKKPVSWMRARRMVSNHPGPSWFQLVNNGLLAAWPCWAMWSFASAWLGFGWRGKRITLPLNCRFRTHRLGCHATLAREQELKKILAALTKEHRLQPKLAKPQPRRRRIQNSL